MTPRFSSGSRCVQRGKWFRNPNKTRPDPVRGSSLDQATRPGGAPHRHSPSWHRHCTPQAAHGHTAAPAMTWLPLNVVTVDNDRGDSPSSCRARVLIRAGAPELPPGSPRVPLGCICKVAAIVVGTCCSEPERARWHDPVLRGTAQSLRARGREAHTPTASCSSTTR